MKFALAPAAASMMKRRLRPAIGQHFDDLWIVAQGLVAAVRHAEQSLSAVCSRKIQSEVGGLFGRWLSVEPDIAVAELVCQHEVDQLLLRRQDGGYQPAVFEPELLPEVSAERARQRELARGSADAKNVDVFHSLAAPFWLISEAFSASSPRPQFIVRSFFLREVQVSIRPDFGADNDILKAACRGNLHQTQLGDILAGIHETVDPSRTIRVVTEVAAREIIKLGYRDYTTAHATINRSIRDIFPTLAS